MTDYNIHYIVCCFLHKRKNLKYTSETEKDAFFFVKKHIEYLRNIKQSNIKYATFVFNIINDSDIELINSFFNNIQINNIKLNVFIRGNSGFSYGAWGEVIQNNLDDNEDYFFLIEDDYIPSNNTFYEPFVEKCSEKTPYICCLANNDPANPHASISNGLIFKNSCKLINNKYGTVFISCGNGDYSSAYYSQMHFYDNFINSGFGISDISDNYCVPFMVSDTNKIEIYGNCNKETLIIPIEV